MSLGSPDLSTPSANAYDSLFSHKRAMVWQQKMYEFVLNRLVEFFNTCMRLI
jgi:hypothetical protein